MPQEPGISHEALRPLRVGQLLRLLCLLLLCTPYLTELPIAQWSSSWGTTFNQPLKSARLAKDNLPTNIKMGWFDGPSRSSSSHYYVRRRSPSRKSAGYSTYHSRHSAPSFFSLGRGGGRSSPSVFSSFSSSSRRARPREGFIQRTIRAIKRLLRDIYRYARHHPIKVFMLVIVPLITSGVLVKLLGMVGLRLPHGIMSALGGRAPAPRGGYGEIGGNGLSESVSSLMNIAKMFA